MTSQAPTPSLAQLPLHPYLNQDGEISPLWAGQVGIYAIFDAQKALQYVGYSRNVALSLKQHLVRQPDRCHWVKVQTVERPSRTLLESIQSTWMAEAGTTPSGNGEYLDAWTQPIDAKLTMTEAEKAEHAQLDELGQIKYLKRIARRLEAEILKNLEQRGVKMDLRFNPKLKESGLLDLKSS